MMPTIDLNGFEISQISSASTSVAFGLATMIQIRIAYTYVLFPEVISYTTRLLEGKGPERATLEDALEILLVYEAYRKPDGIVHRVGK